MTEAPPDAKFDPGTFFREREIDLGAATANDIIAAAESGFNATGFSEALGGWARPRFVFRGQIDHTWGLISSLAREVSGDDMSTVTEARLCEKEREIIERARDRVEGSASGAWLGRNMTDGELLAVLQHQETPTRFLDVTEDALVALYFAVEKEDTTDGRVFLIALNDVPGKSDTQDASDHQGLALSLGDEGSGAKEGLPWPFTTTDKNSNGAWTNEVYLVDAGSLDPRMRAQRGKFVVGGLSRAYGNYKLVSQELDRALNASEIQAVTSFGIGFRATTNAQHKQADGVNAYAWTIRIPGELKPQLRRLLKERHGVHRDSLYPEYKEFKRLAQSIARG